MFLPNDCFRFLVEKYRHQALKMLLPSLFAMSPGDKTRFVQFWGTTCFNSGFEWGSVAGSYTTNAELIKFLTPPMQAVIAKLGGPLGHNVAIDGNETGAVINFLGELQSADNFLGSWNDVTNISPYTVSATNVAKFDRAVE
jgi:hypothetical protein